MDSTKVEGASYKLHVVELALGYLAEGNRNIEKIDLSSLHIVVTEVNREIDAALLGGK